MYLIQSFLLKAYFENCFSNPFLILVEYPFCEEKKRDRQTETDRQTGKEKRRTDWINKQPNDKSIALLTISKSSPTGNLIELIDNACCGHWNRTTTNYHILFQTTTADSVSPINGNRQLIAIVNYWFEKCQHGHVYTWTSKIAARLWRRLVRDVTVWCHVSVSSLQ